MQGETSEPTVHPSVRANGAAVPTAVAGELIVKFKPDAAPAIERAHHATTLAMGIDSLDALLTTYGVTAIERVFPHQTHAPQDTSGLSRIYLLRLDAQADLQAAVAAFKQNPFVEYAEPNTIMTIQKSQGGVQ